MDPRVAAELIQIVDTRVDQLLRQRPRTAYGVVSAVDTANLKASVFVGADPSASGGFSYAPWMTPAPGDRVRVVIDPRGDRYVDELYAALEPAILDSAFDSVTSGSIVCAANAVTDVSTAVATVHTPEEGDFRLWVAGSLRISSPSAANVEAAIQGTVGDYDGTSIDHVALQNTQLSAGFETAYTIVGWLDSAGAGVRPKANLVNDIDVSAHWWIRSSVAQTVGVYADASAQYVSHVYAWITRIGGG